MPTSIAHETIIPITRPLGCVGGCGSSSWVTEGVAVCTGIISSVSTIIVVIGPSVSPFTQAVSDGSKAGIWGNEPVWN